MLVQLIYRTLLLSLTVGELYDSTGEEIKAKRLTFEEYNQRDWEVGRIAARP